MYSIIFSIFFVSLLSLYLHSKYAYKIGLMDIPNERSVHNKSIPRGAGIGFVLSVFFIVLILDFQHFQTYYYIYISILIVFMAGVWDDVKSISPKIKFIFIFLSTILLYLNDFALYSLGTYFGYEVVLHHWIVFPFTFFALQDLLMH